MQQPDLPGTMPFMYGASPRRERVTRALYERVGSPDVWRERDALVANVLAHSPLQDVAAWLSTAAMTGVALGPISVETLCSRIEDSPESSRASWMMDLAAVADSSRGLLAIRDVLDRADDLSYELVRHPHATIEVLASLPGHEVANLVALGFYRSTNADEESPWELFEQDLEAHCQGTGVAAVLLAGGLRHSLCWTSTHLPWDFDTTISVLSALVQKWGTEHVSLAALLCTRSNAATLHTSRRENIVSACAELAGRFGTEREVVARLAYSLTPDIPLERSIQAATAMVYGLGHLE
jgi:antitoxin component HigA of HigAB toxin-antitoxin module